jgi:hypothetical protein
VADGEDFPVWPIDVADGDQMLLVRIERSRCEALMAVLDAAELDAKALAGTEALRRTLAGPTDHGVITEDSPEVKAQLDQAHATAMDVLREAGVTGANFILLAEREGETGKGVEFIGGGRRTNHEVASFVDDSLRAVLQLAQGMGLA